MGKGVVSCGERGCFRGGGGGLIQVGGGGLDSSRGGGGGEWLRCD